MIKKLSELTAEEQTALLDLLVGPTEDCRSTADQIEAYKSLATKGLVVRTGDETSISKAGQRTLAWSKLNFHSLALLVEEFKEEFGDKALREAVMRDFMAFSLKRVE